MKDITSCKTPSPSTVENQQQADNLNEFYCRFEKTNLPLMRKFIRLWKRPSRGCTSFASWESSTCHRICWFSSTLPSLNQSSAHQYLSGSAQLPNLTSEDYRRLSGQLSESLVQPSPLSRNGTYPEWAKGLSKSLWTIYIQHTPSLNRYHLVDATKLWVPERPDTGTVSSLKQSISWTLENSYSAHTLYTFINFLSNIRAFHTALNPGLLSF